MSRFKTSTLQDVGARMRALLPLAVCFVATVALPAACHASVSIGQVVTTVEEGGEGMFSPGLLAVLVEGLIRSLQSRGGW